MRLTIKEREAAGKLKKIFDYVESGNLTKARLLVGGLKGSGNWSEEDFKQIWRRVRFP